MQDAIAHDIRAVQGIGAVPTILETVAAITGLGFVCVARVTQTSWHACAVLDKVDFGLKVGGELDVTTTLCEEVRDSGRVIIIDHVSKSATYCNHHTPRIYGFESYIAIPIYRQNGRYFGTLCGIDPKPLPLSTPSIVSSMTLFAQLISLQLEAEAELADTRDLLADARATAELREQFITILGHDLRPPLDAIQMAAEVARRKEPDPSLTLLLDHIGRSAQRISGLVDDVVDFTRGRMGGSIALDLRREDDLHLAFEQVVEAQRSLHLGRRIETRLQPMATLLCDRARMAQMLSNLLGNALVHGDPAHPVEVAARQDGTTFELSVTNAGPRIPDEVRQQLFKPFWRGSKGLGLGLFIVAEIARAHGGRVEVVSSDKATSFIYTAQAVDLASFGTISG